MHEGYAVFLGKQRLSVCRDDINGEMRIWRHPFGMASFCLGL
jgi:hypothetical protein